MVIQENYQKVLRTFIKRNGGQSVSLFAVLKMDEFIDKWSIILAAPWVNEDNRKSTFTTLANTLIETLSREEIAEIARVTVLPTSSHLVELFLDKFQAGQYIKEDARINGNVIHEGYIIKCSDHNQDGRSSDET